MKRVWCSFLASSLLVPALMSGCGEPPSPKAGQAPASQAPRAAVSTETRHLELEDDEKPAPSDQVVGEVKETSKAQPAAVTTTTDKPVSEQIGRAHV